MAGWVWRLVGKLSGWLVMDRRTDISFNTLYLTVCYIMMDSQGDGRKYCVVVGQGFGQNAIKQWQVGFFCMTSMVQILPKFN